MMKNKILLIAVLFGLVFASCENKVATGNVDEPTMGKKRIAVDETFKPVFEELEKQFESLIPMHTLILFLPRNQSCRTITSGFCTGNIYSERTF